MRPTTTSETASPGYRELREARSDAIEDVAEALAEEMGERLGNLNPDAREHVFALATRAVAVLGESLDDVEKELTAVEDKLSDVEGKLSTSEDELATANGRVDQIEDALEDVLELPELQPEVVAAIEYILNTKGAL